MWLKGNNLIILKCIWDKPLLDGHHPDEGTTLLRPENEMSHENARENWDMPNNNNNSRRLLEEGGAMPIIKPATSPLRWRSVTLYGPFDLITRGRASVCLFWFIRFLTGKSGGNDYKESKFWEVEECVRESWPRVMRGWGGLDGWMHQAGNRQNHRSMAPQRKHTKKDDKNNHKVDQKRTGAEQEQQDQQREHLQGRFFFTQNYHPPIYL